MLRLNENQSSTDWHRFLDIAISIHNTTYAPALGCTPTAVFHGRTPVNALDLRFQNTKLWKNIPKYDSVKELQDKTTELFAMVKENFIALYLTYKKCYDRKANATPLKLHQHCLKIDPKCTKKIAIMNKQQT